MEQNKTIETIGSITKMEHLNSLESGMLKNTLVLHNVTPFPGVRHKDFPGRKSYGSEFIILRYRYAPEKVNRINCGMFKDKELKRYPSYGEIITQDAILPCIRLKEFDEGQVKDVQQYLKDLGLKMMAHNSFDQVCRIKIFKTFKLIEIGNGLFRDLNDGEKIYIQINGDLNWKRFDYIVKKIKSNLENANFDAAMGVIYRFCGPQNVIRIFDQDKTQERALSLRKWFISEVRKEIQISSMH